MPAPNSFASTKPVPMRAAVRMLALRGSSVLPVWLLAVVAACGSSGSTSGGGDGGGGSSHASSEDAHKGDTGSQHDAPLGSSSSQAGSGDSSVQESSDASPGGADADSSTPPPNEDAAGHDASGQDATAHDAGGHDAARHDAHVADVGTPTFDASAPGGNGATCSTTVTPVNVTTPTSVIGTGTAASCTEAEVTTAVAKGGIITFDCGSAAAVIPITKTLILRTDIATTFDGGGTVTLDGGNTTQIFTFTGPNFQVTKTTVTFQHMTFRNARATGSMPFPNASPPCSQGYQVGGGGVIEIRDGVLHVIDSTFETNHGAYPGPDIAGGAIYAIGSLDVTVVGSHFLDNDASNGGAIGSLFSDLTVISSTFTGNKALGSGANSDNSTCPVVGGQRETGSGGNGGAICIDGGETFTVKMCGDVFSQNVAGAGALGGALFRTPDNAMQETDIDQSTFDSNNAPSGGAMYFHNSTLVITNSTVSNNSAGGTGAIQADGTVLNLTNDTFYGNFATTSPGGTISLFGNSGTFTNVTFAKNHCNGAAGQSFGVDLFGGTALTINNSIFDSASQVDPNSPMACTNTNAGANDFQWPKTHSSGTNPDPACVTGIDFADPGLGALANNGGPTETALPPSGSVVIGAGKTCPATDQRGKTRPANGCTAGAVEVP